MGKRFTESELRGASPIWLLDLTLGGRAYRFASETLEIPTDDGDLDYVGTLTGVNFVSEMEFASNEFELPSAGVTVTFREDLARVIAQGADFGAASAELALFRKGSGDDLDDRQVVLTGRIDAPAYGAVGEAVSFNIEADWLRNTTTIPSPSAVIDPSVNWPDADDNATGAIYPILFGAPGQQNFSGSPVYIVDGFGGSGDVVGLVAGHSCTAQTIKVLRVSGATGAPTSLLGEALVGDLDSSNEPYCYVNLTGQYAAGDSYFASFNEGGGGIINPYARNTGAASGSEVGYLTGAGDVVRYLLNKAGVKVDNGRTAAAAAQLNHIEIEGFLAERVDVLDFLKNEILPLLPCSLRASADGLYPVVWRYDARLEDVNARLTAGRDIYRAGLVEYDSGEIYNEITLRYRHNAHYNKLQKAVTVTGDLRKKASAFVWQNTYSVSSFSRYGSRSMDIETELIASRASAGRVINWMSRAYSFQRRTIKYTAPVKMAWLDVGDVVALTDQDLSFSNQLVLIQAIDWTAEGVVFTFLLIQDLPRDTIPA